MKEPDELENLQTALQFQALHSALTEFCSRAGHDLLGPVNQAGSLLGLMVRRYRNQLDGDAEELLNYLQSSAARMERVIAGMGQFIETAARPPRLGPVDLNASLASCRSLLYEEILKSGAVIEAETLPVVSADSGQMLAIFEILISNSIKFRKPDVAPRIRISRRQEGETCAIAVADNGIGIPATAEDIVFQPFRRLNGREYPGAGLGLAMAKLIAELHGCRIGIDPDADDGTCVVFTVRPA